MDEAAPQPQICASATMLWLLFSASDKHSSSFIYVLRSSSLQRLYSFLSTNILVNNLTILPDLLILLFRPPLVLRIRDSIMSHPEDVHTNEGRLATFSASQPAKRRASATRKRAAATLTWPHESPNPDDVSRVHPTDSKNGQLTCYSSPKRASTLPQVGRVQIIAAVFCVTCNWTAGKMATIRRWSTTHTHLAVAGPSTVMSIMCSRHQINPWMKTRCPQSMSKLEQPPSRVLGLTRISVDGSARFQRFVPGKLVLAMSTNELE
jgi:hypothetical protein